MTIARRFSLSMFLVSFGVLVVSSAGAMFPSPALAADYDLPHLQAGASRGSVSEELALATAYMNGKGVTQDLKMAAYWYEKAAKSGDPLAENQIGFLYQTGQGVQADPVRAFHWYQLAAAAGVVRAKTNLAVLYSWGTGVAQDQPLAAKLFQEAAKEGDGYAAGNLGNLYYFGRGVKQDRAVAEAWFKTGVKMHDPISAFNLGLLWSTVADHPHDVSRAASLLRKSADAGYVKGMSSLGSLLLRHPELAHSASEARSLLERASAAGSWRSTVVLGILARDGIDAAPDPETAYYLFCLAALQGGGPAREFTAHDLPVLAEKLPPERPAALKARADESYRQHPDELEFISTTGRKEKAFPTRQRAVPEIMTTPDAWSFRSLPVPTPARGNPRAPAIGN